MWFQIGQVGSCCQFSRRVAPEKELQGPGSFVPPQDLTAQIALSTGHIIAAELDVYRSQQCLPMASTDKREAFFEIPKSLFGQFHQLLSLGQIDPGLCGIDRERQTGSTVISQGRPVVGVGGIVEISEAPPEINFPARAEGESIGAAGYAGGRTKTAMAAGS